METIYAVDIGSTRARPPSFAWASVRREAPETVVGGVAIDDLVAAMREDLARGRSVALGLEAPLFLPIPAASRDLSRGRVGEGNRSFAAPAGAAVTTLGMHQAAWVLRALRQVGAGSPVFTLDWRRWPPPEETQLLFVWEAFVSGPAHSTEHVRDAATAAIAFLGAEESLSAANAVCAENPMSLIGAVAIWSGWTENVDVLQQASLVIKPNEPYAGAIHTV